MGDCGLEAIREQEVVVENMRTEIKSERTNRWTEWVAKSWDTKKNNIYRWIRAKKGQGQLIVLPGGSAQMIDRMRVAQEAWGGLW
eukprot:3455469-Heterocapsa_arctica.AAC.1